MEKKKRTIFIKPSRSINGTPKLDPVLVAVNKSKNKETTLTLDSNILIKMEKVVHEGNKWSSVKKYGLHNLVKLLRNCPPKSICLSPGLALREMPPKLAEQSKRLFEKFCAFHLPGFQDAPNSILELYSGSKKEYGFFDLCVEEQAALAIPFSAILYLNIVEKLNLNTPLQKFTKFLDFMEHDVDILSAIEAEVAKYCFVEPPADSRITIESKRSIRKNFLKTGNNKLPLNSNEVFAIAFNAACDLRLLLAANVIDSHGVSNVAQDCWIATQDEKLVAFSNVFHHVNISGETGKYAASVQHPEHTRDIYWVLTQSEYSTRVLRRSDYNESREVDASKLINVAESAAELVKQYF